MSEDPKQLQDWLDKTEAELQRKDSCHIAGDNSMHEGTRDTCERCNIAVGLQHIAVDQSVHKGPAHPCASCDAMEEDGFAYTMKDCTSPIGTVCKDPACPLHSGGSSVDMPANEETQEDWVNPKHYQRGPKVSFKYGISTISKVVQCIEIVRWIPDFRLANAIRYIWRVGFGGKWNNDEDIRKAMWYLQDYLDNPVKGGK